MIQLGKIQTLEVVQLTTFGVYLARSNMEVDNRKRQEEDLPISKVLLPKNQTSADPQIGDSYRVFVYKDSEDRPIATTTLPPLELYGFAPLKVKEISAIGAFLDWGLAKDLLLPFKEQTYRPEIGDTILVKLYIDKSKRLCATMKVYESLRTDSNYQRNDKVHGIVYEIIDAFGAFIAVDHCFSALLPKDELYGQLKPGMEVDARVAMVQDDGKLTLSLRAQAYQQLDEDAALILEELTKAGGVLPYHDKSDPMAIKDYFHISKNAFKRGIGHLQKDGKIVIEDTCIRMK